MAGGTWYRAAALLTLFVSAVAVAGCGGGPRSRPAAPPSERLTLGLVGFPGSIDPLTADTPSAADIDSLVYDGLVRESPQQTALPDLASSWRVAPDGLHWTFRLRKARWQDGTAVTAQDVAFSLRAYMNRANGSAAAGLLRDVAAVDTSGERTLRITLKRPDAAFLLNAGTLPVLPAHLLDGLKPGRELLSSPYLGSRIVGTGPFVLRAAHAGQYTFTANPRYFLGRPRLAGLSLRVYTTAAAALSDLQKGKIDYSPVPGPDAAAVRTWRGVRVVSVPLPDYLMVGWNLLDGEFSSPALRRALVYAVNRTAIVQNVLGGAGVVARGMLPTTSWAFDRGLRTVPYDPSQARTLLEAAGYRASAGPYLVGPSGKPLVFTILVNTESSARLATARMVAADLRAVGVDASVRPEAFAQYANDLVTGNFSAAILERGIGPDPDQSAYYLSAQRAAAPTANFTAYGDHTVDTAILAELTATDQSTRFSAFQTAQQAMALDPPGIFLYYPLAVSALSSRFGGFTPNGQASLFASYLWFKR